MAKVRLALIGLGGQGKKYAAMLDQAGEDFPLILSAVVCRRESGKTWLTEKLTHRPAVFPDTQALYAQGQLFDAVLVVTPSKTHADLAVEALQNGKHVLVDKPAATSLQDAKRVELAAKRSGCLYGLMFHQRLYPQYRRIKELIDQGELGELRRVSFLTSRYFRTAQYHRQSVGKSSWNGDGGGALINQGPHILDIWQWLFGVPETVFAAIPFGKYNDFDVDDEATILMTYPQKMTGTFTLTTGEPVWSERMEIAGTKGRVLLEKNRLKVTRFGEDLGVYAKTSPCSGRDALPMETTVEAFPSAPEPYLPVLRNFAEAVLCGKPLIAPGNEGICSLLISSAAYLSAWTGERVTLPFDAQLFDQALLERCRKERNQ